MKTPGEREQDTQKSPTLEAPPPPTILHGKTDPFIYPLAGLLALYGSVGDNK